MVNENARGSASDGRARVWAAIVYPDSAPENWRDILDEEHLQWVESPLHEFDVNPTGEVKKAHWHIVLVFEGKKSYEQICDILKSLNCSIPQRCHSLKGSVRYMAHLDNPEKYQYDISDIVCHGGLDLADLLKPSSSERYSLIAEMQDFIKENGIIEFQDLLDFARSAKFDTWYPLLCDNSAYVISLYIKSQRHRILSSGVRR